jgi:4'-phosphopantetheinyl transferase
MVVCAVEFARTVGIDAEQLARGADVLGVADNVFAPSELQWLARLEPPRKAEGAARIWTLKEAYIKARGMGLSIPLTAFAVSVGFGNSSSLAVAPPDDDASRWQLTTSHIEDHVVSTCVERRGDGMEPMVCRPMDLEGVLLRRSTNA